MSILIENMKMPKNCNECRFSVDDWCYVCTPQSEEERKRITSNYCPLVEIPPHGRLIDADALLKSISRAIEDDSDIADVYEEDYELVNDWLASAPTIIEAEETNNEP